MSDSLYTLGSVGEGLPLAGILPRDSQSFNWRCKNKHLFSFPASVLLLFSQNYCFSFFITLLRYHGHFISCLNTNGCKAYEIMIVEAMPMRVIKPMERMAGCTAKSSDATTMTRMTAEKKMATLGHVRMSRLPVRACESKPSMMKML